MTLALYTTIYPGVEPFLPDWYQSVCRQTDRDFELWIGLDATTPETVRKIVGADINARWVTAPAGAGPGRIRQEALAKIVESCSGVVLTDSDDRLHPTRVAAARESLAAGDLGGCALSLVDQTGRDLGIVFGLPPGRRPDEVLPRNNIYGFSNSAFRSTLLRRCLPIPAEAVLVDWFLVTRAWLFGAQLTFDPEPRMDYRQHAANTARVRAPFRREQVVSDTTLVRKHFSFFPHPRVPGVSEARARALQEVADDVEKFQQRVVAEPGRLDDYVAALNGLRLPPLWWSCVANPALSPMWRER